MPSFAARLDAMCRAAGDAAPRLAPETAVPQQAALGGATPEALDTLLAGTIPPDTSGPLTGCEVRLMGLSLIVFGLLCNFAAAHLAGVQVHVILGG